MSNNVVCGSFRSKRRANEDRGNRILRCEISERCIQLSVATDLTSDDADYMRLEIMTNDSDNRPRKLRELRVNRSILYEMIKDISTIDHRGTENE